MLFIDFYDSLGDFILIIDLSMDVNGVNFMYL